MIWYILVIDLQLVILSNVLLISQELISYVGKIHFNFLKGLL